MLRSEIALRWVERIRIVLLQRGLAATFSRQGILEFAGARWLVLSIPGARIPKPELYLNSTLENHLSMAIGGKPVFVHNIIGSVVITAMLGNGIRLPKNLTLTEENQAPYVLQIGRNISGNEVVESWQTLGHVLVGGMTGSGKSVFLRNVVTQAIYDRFILFLVDADEMTFAALDGHEKLGAPVGNLNSANEVLEIALKEMMVRQAEMKTSFPSVDNYWSLPSLFQEEHRPMLIAIDEANGLISALGGNSGEFASNLKQLAWRGRKFGIILVVAGQTFEKSVVGGMRDQLATKICFKVANAHVSRVILGRAGAEKLKSPGRAITNRWGLVQTYNILPFHETVGNLPTPISQEETAILREVLELFDGRLTFSNLGEMKMTRTEAEQFRTKMEALGIASKDPQDRNTMTVTEKGRGLIFPGEITN